MTFSFKDWYAKHGYQTYGGRKRCAELIPISERHINNLLEGKRQPGDVLVKLCEYIDYFGRLPVDK